MKKKWKLSLGILVVAALSLSLLAGCTSGSNEEEGEFSYSTGIDDKGYWKGVKAKDYVTLPGDLSISIPKDSHTVSDESVQTEIDSLVASYATANEITDRAVADGDTVNIDYVGTVDGVEFEGGNTGGAGTEVTIGTTNYVGNFLEQLIGHMPGESFNVEVTFPEDYSTAELAGKDAVFATTINFVSESINPELTDAFVAENLSTYGWTTVDQMKEGIKKDLQDQAVQNYLSEYLMDEVEVKSVPDSIIKYQDNAMLLYYEQYAKSYEVSLDEFLTTYVGVDSKDALIEQNAEANKQTATYSLIVQAVAEDQKFTANDEDVKNYFSEYMGADDYSQYEEQYGMNYLKQVALSQKVLNYLTENAKLEE